MTSNVNTPNRASARRGPGRPVSLDKRRAMLDAAVTEFQRAGYAGASMDAIAASARISKRTVYNHFPNKEALFRFLVDELGKRIAVTTHIEFRADEAPRTQLLRFAGESAKLLRDRDTLALFRAVIAEHVRTPGLVEKVLERYWRSEYGFTAWVEHACASGKLRAASPARAAHHFQSLVKGVLVWPAVFGRKLGSRKETDDSVTEAIDMFLSYYGAGR